MSTRRSALRTITTAMGLVLSTTWPTATAAGRAPTTPWHDEQLADMREASIEEQNRIIPDLRRRVAALQQYSSMAISAPVGATVGLSSRGTTILRATLSVDSSTIFLMVKELDHSFERRSALLTFGTDGSTYLQRLNEQEIASGWNDAPIKVSGECCGEFGTPPGTCCRYDLQGLFECCTPCVFGGVPLGIACVLLWCNYCAVAHCKEYYHPC